MRLEKRQEHQDRLETPFVSTQTHAKKFISVKKKKKRMQLFVQLSSRRNFTDRTLNNRLQNSKRQALDRIPLILLPN